MSKKEAGALDQKAPSEKIEACNSSTGSHYSANGTACKPFDTTIFNRFDRTGIKAQLQAYLNLGMTPIPLRGKIPVVRWQKGNWNPRTITDLMPFIRQATNWGIKTGAALSVIDFDTKEAFTRFIVTNIDKLPENVPIVRTGRGYHIWFRPAEPLKDAHYDGIDIKGIGGQVVAPPSIHPKTGRRYKFIRPPKGPLPELDISKLDFPELKKRESAARGVPVGRKSYQSAGTGPRFNPDSIKDGVDEGSRHTTLVAFIGYLMAHYRSREEIYDEALYWNEHNNPPMFEAEVLATVDDVWQRYDRGGNLFVPIKTQRKNYSVLIETETNPGSSRRRHIFEDDAPPEGSETNTDAGEDEDPWKEEPPYPHSECGKRRVIVRKGHRYMSVAFFCGRWDCPQCGPFFRQRWIDHIVKVAGGADLYTADVGYHEWDRVRRAMNRLGANYMKVHVDGHYKLITDKPLKRSSTIESGDIRDYLDSIIPNTTPSCPITTSRGWRRGKHKQEKDYTKVTISWLPVKEQAEVAEELGAKVTAHARWDSPYDVDEDEWAELFKSAIKEREKNMNWWMNHPTYGEEMRNYLKRQYIEDLVDDEFPEDPIFSNIWRSEN